MAMCSDFSRIVVYADIYLHLRLGSMVARSRTFHMVRHLCWGRLLVPAGIGTTQAACLEMHSAINRSFYGTHFAFSRF